MTSGLEAAALSGELFRPRSLSPARSDSTSSPLNTDDELASDLDDASHDGINGSSTALVQNQNETKGSRTGIKGVLNDKKADDAHRRQVAKVQADQLRRGMEKAAITLPTPSPAGGVEEWRKKRMMELEAGRRGLKEIGKEGFVGAVEKRGWVLVLIYEPVCPGVPVSPAPGSMVSGVRGAEGKLMFQDIPRCQDLLASTLELSTTLAAPSTHLDTPITLLRARATTLAFSLLPPSTRTRHEHRDEEGDDGDEQEEREADPDVLPTILAYRDGELERKWIRVDWDIGEGSLETLLRR